MPIGDNVQYNFLSARQQSVLGEPESQKTQVWALASSPIGLRPRARDMAFLSLDHLIYKNEDNII